MSGSPEPQQFPRWSRRIRILNSFLEEAHSIEKFRSIKGWSSTIYKITIERLLLLWTQGASLNRALRWWRHLRHFNVNRGLRLRLRGRHRCFRHRLVEVRGRAR